MWLFTSQGMLSVVAHRDIPNSLMVRARSPDHITKLFPEADVELTVNADYAYRSVIDRSSFALFMINYIAEMNYDNFKNSIIEESYLNHCNQVWSTMYRYGSLIPKSARIE